MKKLIAIIKPCCYEMANRLSNMDSKIRYDSTQEKFILHDGEGYNPEEIKFCPYCGSKLTVFMK